jgi:hypothetical protein
MPAPTCKRCGQPVVDDAGTALECPRCAGPIEDTCFVCEIREVRGQELRRCVGCDRWLCGRAQCARDGFENLAKRSVGRTCAACVRKREIVPRPGGAKALGSGAGVEAVDRARYYLYEATGEVDDRLRDLAGELERRLDAVAERAAQSVAGAVKSSIGELEAATGRQLEQAAGRLGRALEDALAKGLERGATAVRERGSGLIGELGTTVRAARLPFFWIGLLILLVNGACTVGIVLALR